MKLSVMQENLARGLSTVSRAVSSRSSLPVLANVLLRTEDAGLKLTATNLEIGITSWVPGKIDTEGALTVPARLLTDVVGGLPAGERVDLEVDGTTLSHPGGTLPDPPAGHRRGRVPGHPCGRRTTHHAGQPEGAPQGALGGRVRGGQRRGPTHPDGRPDALPGDELDPRRGRQLPHRGQDPRCPVARRGHQHRGPRQVLRGAHARPRGHGRPGRHHARARQQPGHLPRRHHRPGEPAHRRPVPELPAGRAHQPLQPRASWTGTSCSRPCACQRSSRQVPRTWSSCASARRARRVSPSPPPRMWAMRRARWRPRSRATRVTVAFNARYLMEALQNVDARPPGAGAQRAALVGCASGPPTMPTTSTSSCRSGPPPETRAPEPARVSQLPRARGRPAAGPNVVVGHNAAGKTNLLEAHGGAQPGRIAPNDHRPGAHHVG